MCTCVSSSKISRYSNLNHNTTSLSAGVVVIENGCRAAPPQGWPFNSTPRNCAWVLQHLPVLKSTAQSQVCVLFVLWHETSLFFYVASVSSATINTKNKDIKTLIFFFFFKDANKPIHNHSAACFVWVCAYHITMSLLQNNSSFCSVQCIYPRQ